MLAHQLTAVEVSELLDLEITIKRNIKAFYEVGNALLHIRDKKLYREGYDTFEEYCREKWGMEKSRTYQLMDSAKVVGNLKETSTTVELPTTERQARPLASLAPAEQREVWQEAVESAPEGRVTAQHVEEAADKRKKKGNRPTIFRGRLDVPGEEFMAAWDHMRIALLKEEETFWKSTPRKLAIQYVELLLRLAYKLRKEPRV